MRIRSILNLCRRLALAPAWPDGEGGAIDYFSLPLTFSCGTNLPSLKARLRRKSASAQASALALARALVDGGIVVLRRRPAARLRFAPLEVFPQGFAQPSLPILPRLRFAGRFHGAMSNAFIAEKGGADDTLARVSHASKKLRRGISAPPRKRRALTSATGQAEARATAPRLGRTMRSQEARGAMSSRSWTLMASPAGDT
jgi:hypothetical protein